MHFRLLSPKGRHKDDQDPATIYSAVNSTLHNISARLASSLTVNAIIGAIRRREVVHRLNLGDSCLGDVGCVRLFEFLNSPSGLHCRESLTELFLTKNDIGARGLLAVVAFLRNNIVLRELCLSGNPLTTDPEVIAEFASALNSSRLCTLQILHNSSLGDPFVQALVPRLTTPYLRQLDMSAINMTRAVVPVLVDYVKSPRCRLERLQCNANSLTLGGARMVVNAIEEGNYTLWKVNLDDLHIDEHDGDGEIRTIAWQEGWRVLSAAVQRNLDYKVQLREQSLALLRHCRALFLRSGGMGGSVCSFASVSCCNRNSRSAGPPPFSRLPVEIQQEIISYLAPSLSHRQRMRIVCFAADITTLSQLGHKSDAARGCKKNLETFVRTGLGKRSTSQQRQPFEGTWRPPTWWECRCPIEAQANCCCLRRWRKERRDMWLTQVACDAYEPAH
ncbi:RNI-like protein [Gyrodon lividus]|nr:RNI-like protein [Gyrodon lividus]